MTDPLDELKRAMKGATPAPDPVRRAATVARALDLFEESQGSATRTRPTLDRLTGWAGLKQGGTRMLASLAARPALATVTGLAALGLVVVAPMIHERTAPEGLPDTLLSAAVVGPDETFAAESDVEFAEMVMMAKETVSDELEAAARYRVVAEDPILFARSERAAETFANADPQPVRIVAEEPVSTFSIDVDTASWAVIRSSLERGHLPLPDAVRIEEMINYFPYAHPRPGPQGAPFRPTVTVTETPWNPDTQLIHVALQGRAGAVEHRPPLNLVFLIDTSGSMEGAARLPLLVQSFRLMLEELRPQDQVAIVTYAGSAGLVLDATPASDRDTIVAALRQLHAGGSTAGAQGLQLAYETAQGMAAEADVTRVILATDGDFNVGIADPDALEAFIARKRRNGIYLNVLGFGRGNLNDATMQTLAQNGNGQAAYIDTLSEAHKVLVDQLTGALFPIADDVKVQVEFNPATVAEYRLIGYETRVLGREDFNNDTVDAGEIGAGHSVTAIYEITPVGSPARLSDPLRYADPAEPAHGADGELAFLRLRYKEPGEDTSRLIELPITPGMGAASTDTRFAVAVAGFGQLLTESRYLGDWSYGEAIALARANTGDDPFGYRREAVSLMRLASSLTD